VGYPILTVVDGIKRSILHPDTHTHLPHPVRSPNVTTSRIFERARPDTSRTGARGAPM